MKSIFNYLDVKKITRFVVYIMAVVFVAYYLGVIAFIQLPALGLNYEILGSSLDQMNTSPNIFEFYGANILYPYGKYANEGFSYLVIIKSLLMIGMDSWNALSLTYFLVFLLSFHSLLYIFYIISKNFWLSLFFCIIFFLDPFLTAQNGIPPMIFGLFVLPFSILLDIKLLFNNNNQYNKKIIWINKILIIFGRLFIVGMGWYTAIITAVLSCVFFLSVIIFEIISTKKVKEAIIYYIKEIVFPWFIAMLIIMMITPKSATSSKVSLEFLNGTSVSLITLFLPHKSQLISKFLLSLEDVLGTRRLTGDGTMYYNYLGYTMIMISIFLIFRRSKSNNKKYLYAIAITGILGMILAIGPGIKGIGITEEDSGTYASYLYDMENVIKLPWMKIYNIFPLSAMRSVYRWMVIPKVSLLFLSLIGCKNLLKSKYNKLLIIVCSLILFEVCPVTLKNNNANNMNMAISFERDVINEMKKDIKKGEIIAVTGYGKSTNFYLLPLMINEIGAVTYSGAGDKSIEEAKEFIADDIMSLQKESEPEKIAMYIENVIEKGLCNYVLLPAFYLRDNAYSWYESRSGKEEIQSLINEVLSCLNNEYKVIKKENYTLVSKEEDVSNIINKDKAVIDIEKTDKSHDCANLYCTLEYNGKLLVEIQQINSIGEVLEKKNYKVSLSGLSKLERSIYLLEDTECLYIEFSDEEGNPVNYITAQAKTYSSDKVYNEQTIKELDGIGFQNINGYNNITINEKEVIFDKDSYISVNSNQFWEGSNLTCNFEVFIYDLLEAQDIPLLTKWNYWGSNMSFAFSIKGEKCFILLSDDGKEKEMFWFDKMLLKDEQWNQISVTFSQGSLEVSINGHVFCKDTITQNIYEGDANIVIGKGLRGKIRNFNLEFQ